jgi:Mrp family chromosome partitioning ATPase
MAVELKDIENALNDIILPAPKRSLIKFNMVRDIQISDGNVSLNLSLTPLSEPQRDSLLEIVRAAIEGLPGVEQLTIDVKDVPPQEMNEFKRVVAVMSGKGGVGKSLVTALLAVGLSRDGQDVGILDADITGPSIPKMFGLTTRPLGSEGGILPVETHSGIEVMSLNLLLPNEDDAVIWRGPLLAKAIVQFWQEVAWGKLDCLMVDLPPGTADIPLTVLQTIPLSGIIIVSTPQDLTSMVVRKAVNMARTMEIPILGVVENMSYLVIPDSGKRIDLFGKSRGEEMAKAAGSPLLGRIPVDPELAELCDSGEIERYSSETFDSLAGAFKQVLEAAPPPIRREQKPAQRSGKATG